MEVFLIRHAEAVERSPGVEDASRPLTEDGARRFRQVVKGLERLEIGMDRLYHSPLLRCVETAEILSRLLTGESVVTPLLASAPGEALLADLLGERIALVGHEPWLSELCALLLIGVKEAGRVFPFKKGAVAHLEGECKPGAMTLRAFYPPRFLRAGKR